MSPRQPDNFDYISPLDSRYYGNDKAVYAALHDYLSEAATIGYQLKVELALVETLETHRVAPLGISQRLRAAASAVTPQQVYDEEERTHHNIRALVNCLRKELPPSDSGYVHLFATSADIQDTARSLALRDFSQGALLPALRDLISHLVALAEQHRATPQIGRTHGRHAEPITVGYWLANFIMRLVQRAEMITDATANLRGMFSGAVGAHSALALRWPDNPSAIEEQVLARLGLKPGGGAVSTQVVQPEYLCDYAHALVSTFGVLANIADDYRQLMRSEIEEVRERLDEYQVGSSTMPHKINPKNFENVKSLWKATVPRMVTVYMDQISEHQRDLTNSASTRFFNELAATTYYATYRLTDAIKKTEFDFERIAKNLENSHAWTIAEPLYIAFALAGDPNPYYRIRDLVLKARQSGESLSSVLENDPASRDLWAMVPDRQKEIIRNPGRYVGDAVARTSMACEAANLWIRQTFSVQQTPNADSQPTRNGHTTKTPRNKNWPGTSRPLRA